MNDQDIKNVNEWLIHNDKELIMDFVYCDDVQGSVIKNSVEELSEVSDRIHIKIKKEGECKESFLSAKPNIVIKGEMKGKILEILIDIIDELVADKLQKYTEISKKITTPLFLKLYVAPNCPHCPIVARELSSLSTANSNINLEIIDGLLFPEKAENDEIRSVPTLIFNENFRWVGQFQISEVVDVLTNIDPKNLSSRSIQTMIEAGKANVVAELMLKEGVVFNSLFDLLVNEKWSVRLGAMVVAEEIGHGDKLMANQLIENLWSRYDTVGDTVKGDIVYLIGEIGSAIYIEKLKSLVQQNPVQDVLDALKDSLETLTNRLLNN